MGYFFGRFLNLEVKLFWNFSFSFVEKIYKSYCFLSLSTFFIPPKLISCENIAKLDTRNFFLQTNCFFAFWLLKNTRLAKIALLWDFRLISYFMYKIWAKQSLHVINLKQCWPFILSLQNRENIFYCKAENSIFSHFYFSAQTIWKKIHKFEVCCINPYK